MKRLTLLLLLAGAPALAGCIPMMALSAADLAARSAEGTPVSNQSLSPQARDACTAQAARYGTVHVIDVEQHRVNQMIVWGTVDDGQRKRSFECDFGSKISGFKLRPIAPEH